MTYENDNTGIDYESWRNYMAWQHYIEEEKQKRRNKNKEE